MLPRLTADTATTVTVALFVCVYLGMALGRWPGLRLDRTGIAMLGAITLYALGIVDGWEAMDAVDFPTLFLLFGLMVVSSQYAVSGFYDWCSSRIAATRASPTAILALVIVVSGVLSAILANDVVVFAMTPLLCLGLKQRGLDVRPFLVALACAANAGSAATLIGNPQNILIGQVGQLDFWQFGAVCAPPAVAALLISFVMVRLQWRGALAATGNGGTGDAGSGEAQPSIDRGGLVKAVLATLILLGFFTTGISHVTGVLVIAGALLVSRKLATKQILGLVDWHLLVLFGALFIVTKALQQTGLPADFMAALANAGILLDRLEILAPLSLIGSNTIGNVPAVMLLLSVAPDLSARTLYALAVLSTLAGNLFILGSLANIIVVERAKEAGVSLGFVEHAKTGVPVTLLSFAAALAWFWWLP